jgi:glycosyltransferase involved in cell wall biosynthesis
MVKNHTVIVLHQFGNRKHYQALENLLKKNNVKFIFCGLDLYKNFIKSIFYFDFKILNQCLKTLRLLFYLSFTKKHKVILGMRPFNINLIPLSIILRKHKIYYHTSYPEWGKHHTDNLPKKSFLNSFWVRFVNNCSHIFVANNFIKDSIVKELKISKEKISVVYHSFDEKIFKTESRFNYDKNFLKFIYVGRITESKGIKKILKIFKNSKINSHITFVGKGGLQNKVKDASLNYDNIHYHGFEKNQNKLSKLLCNANYLLVPSIKQKVWEELFGINIIEAMACGVVPIASKHIGPKEIIEDNVDGLLFNEHNYEEQFYDFYNQVDQQSFAEMREKAILKSKKFTINNIASNWLKILE